MQWHSLVLALQGNIDGALRIHDQMTNVPAAFQGKSVILAYINVVNKSYGGALGYATNAVQLLRQTEFTQCSMGLLVHVTLDVCLTLMELETPAISPEDKITLTRHVKALVNPPPLPLHNRSLCTSSPLHSLRRYRGIRRTPTSDF